MMNWHSMSIEEVFEKLGSGINGLSSIEASERLRIYGLNEIALKKESPIVMFLKQFTNVLIIILIIATLISLVLGEVVDAIAILIIVLIMGVSGFIQEYRAEKTLEALRKLAAPTARVIRDGVEVEIPASMVVPGDVIVLREGDRVPADARLIESEDLEVDESSLTGESTPVVKNHDVILPVNTIIAERKNMVFMGTYVVKGRGKAVVVSTGLNTEFGKIARMIRETGGEQTPLEIELNEFGKRIGLIILAICAIVFLTSILKGGLDLLDALMLSVALGVAAIPEGLPAIATAILAIGARRMAKKNALVKKLAAVESLGAVDVICSDKTGTITKAEMTVKVIKLLDREYEVEGSGYEPRGVIKGFNNDDDLKFMLEILAAHTTPDVKLVNDNGKWIVKGSPTEGAALVLCYKGLGFDGVKESIEKYKLVKTFPFDRFRKRKSTIHSYGDRFIIVSSGAPEVLLGISKWVRVSGVETPLTDELRERVNKQIVELASNGYRTYAVAYKVVDNPNLNMDEAEKDLVFLGVMGIIDPPREGVREAVETARKAGIKVVMVTGDHKLTAMAIARMIGLDVSEETVLDGSTLDRLSDEELEKVVDKINVYARVTPEHKVRIVKAFKKKGYRVAMTGDGVNDAPALKAADVGVAMGIKGTEVAKEASQLILLDDNFVTIVEAVKEGRVIYENLKKPINYLLTCNLGEVIAVFGSEILGYPPILQPIHLLWINVTTDAFPAIALGLEPPEPGILEKPPRPKHERFITRRKLLYYVLMGLIIGLTTIWLYALNLDKGYEYAQTIAFTAIVFSEFGRAFVSRSENVNIWRLKWNKWLIPAILISLILHLIVLYTPLNNVFKVIPLPLESYTTIFIVPLLILFSDELRKILGIKISTY